MGVIVIMIVSEVGVNLVMFFGVDEIINYKIEKFEDILKNYDVVFDIIGGVIFEKLFNIIKRGGNIVFVLGMLNVCFGKEFGLGFFKIFLFLLVSKKFIVFEKKYNV